MRSRNKICVGYGECVFCFACWVTGESARLQFRSNYDVVLLCMIEEQHCLCKL